jgi:hypothetical protein
MYFWNDGFIQPIRNATIETGNPQCIYRAYSVRLLTQAPWQASGVLVVRVGFSQISKWGIVNDYSILNTGLSGIVEN